MPDPAEDYFTSKEAAKETRKEKELQLWQHWKDNGKQAEHLQPLLKLYDPVLGGKVRAWKAPNVPESAFKAELTTHLIKAFETYDPSRGAALNTHVEARLPKAMRYNNKHQNVGYIPEGQARYIGAIRKAQDTLNEEFGRDPTPHEIADHLQTIPDMDYRKLTAARVGTILDAVKRDVPMSKFETDPTEFAHSFEEQQIAVAQGILPSIFPNKPEMHELFNHTFGTNGFQKIQSTGVLAKKMGKSQSQISRMKTQMGATLRKHMGLNDQEE